MPKTPVGVPRVVQDADRVAVVEMVVEEITIEDVHLEELDVANLTLLGCTHAVNLNRTSHCNKRPCSN